MPRNFRAKRQHRSERRDRTICACQAFRIVLIRTHGKGGTGSDQLSIDLIDGAAAVCYVTSKELEYMMVQSWGVGVGKRVMP